MNVPATPTGSPGPGYHECHECGRWVKTRGTAFVLARHKPADLRHPARVEGNGACYGSGTYPRIPRWRSAHPA